MELRRGKFQGVLNILSFNRHFYIIGLSTLLVFGLSHYFINSNTSLFLIVLIAFIYGLIAPLIVSAYVYDFSGYYKMLWLNKLKLNSSKIKQVVNINAGFDETSFIMNKKFETAQIRVFDFYDSKRHTEPAIVRARKVSSVFPNTQQINSRQIPMSNKSADIIFLLSALHEIRSNSEKIDFLKECRRVLKPEGHLIIVEHLRDLPNLLAFSFGFTHFFSKKTWLDVLKKARFVETREFKFTPFMSIFVSNI